ncbi:MAG: protoporphyrinogen oxidase, partial [Ignavibacteriota bacterium]
SLPGGPIQTIRRDGFLAEAGPNTIVENSLLITSMITDLGLDSSKVYSSPHSKNRFIVRDGKLQLLPVSTSSFISTKLFSASAKLRILAEPFISASSLKDEESVADFFRRRFGDEVVDYAIDPFISGIFAGDAEKLSMSSSFNKIYKMEQSYGSLIKGQIFAARARRKSGALSPSRKMFSFDEGLQILIDKLFQRLESDIKLNTTLNRIEQLAEGWNVHYNDKGTEYIQHHSSIILTLPAYRLAEIRHNIEGVDLQPLGSIHYPPVASLALGFKRSEISHDLGGFGMLVPSKEKFSILGTLFSSSLFAGRAPKDHALLTTYLGGVRNPELGDAHESYQIETVLRDLRLLLGVKGEPVFINRSFFRKAIPQYELGYERHIRNIEEIEMKAPGLCIAGNFRNGISVPDCIISGMALADDQFTKLRDSQ